jgi:hypothetical protein
MPVIPAQQSPLCSDFGNNIALCLFLFMPSGKWYYGKEVIGVDVHCTTETSVFRFWKHYCIVPFCSGRVVFWNMGVTYSYTLEASYGGSNLGITLPVVII